MNLKVMDKSMPLFDKQFYAISVPEDIEIHSPLSVSIKAESPLSRKLIYSISSGNTMEQFAVDFNTGKNETGNCGAEMEHFSMFMGTTNEYFIFQHTIAVMALVSINFSPKKKLGYAFVCICFSLTCILVALYAFADQCRISGVFVDIVYIVIERGFIIYCVQQ